jgi:hypothetical protein
MSQTRNGLQVARPPFDWWYISEQNYIAKWAPINRAREAIITQALKINEKIKKGQL